LIALYLAALIFGLGVLLLQFILPSHGTEHPGDSDALDTHEQHSHEGASGPLAVLLSLRFWTFGFLAFGMVGSLLHSFSLTSDAVTLVLALVMGLTSGALAAWTFIALKRGETASGVDARNCVGHIGRVVLALHRQQPGKVRIQLGGTTLDLVATTDESSLEQGAHVLIEEVRGTSVHVSRAPDLLIPEKT
jgi:membrane protein implicated in regulation of membrane protease activity